MQSWAEDCRREGLQIALVPTMGALHEGHLSLVRVGRARADRVVASIFVNPLQFNSPEDFQNYPTDDAGDTRILDAEGVDVLFQPSAEEMYPSGAQTRVEVTELSQPLCGAHRPGHFLGVTTVVAKLLLAVKPHLAVFGEKDYQQLQVVRRMTRDLNFDVDIVAGPIVREADGLAMSSRNRRLTQEWRQEATAIPRGLEAAGREAATGERRSAALVAAFRKCLADTRLRIEYAEIRDAEELHSVDTIEAPAILAVAVWADDVRLIDNSRIEISKAAETAAGGRP